jgi:ankyrin repeat protein
MGNSKSLYSKGDQLYFYIEKNDTANILKLLDSNPELLNNSLTKDTKHTAILRASFNGNIQLVRLFAERKADLNYVTPKG